MQPWLLYVVKGLLQLLQRARQEAFPWVTAPVVPKQALAQAQKSHFHILFSVTKSVPSPFHHAELQTATCAGVAAVRRSGWMTA